MSTDNYKRHSIAGQSASGGPGAGSRDHLWSWSSRCSVSPPGDPLQTPAARNPANQNWGKKSKGSDSLKIEVKS